MELKKNPHADIYRLTNLFFNLGLAISISLVFTVFQYKVYDNSSALDLGEVAESTDEIIDIPLTVQPPPPPPKVQLPEIIEIPDEELIIDDIELNLDIEMHQDTRIDEFAFNEFLNTDPPDAEEADKIFSFVEQEAEPANGIEEFYRYVSSQLQDNYPVRAVRMNIEGLTYIQFVVEKDGSITDVTAVKGIGGGCDELAVEVLRNSPKWSPGRQRGVPVRSLKVIPIKFVLK